MNNSIKEAYNSSIAHWERLSKCKTVEEFKAEGIGPDKCGFCLLFLKYYAPSEDNCIGCPIYNATGKKYCHDTPYNDMADKFFDFTNGVSDEAPHKEIQEELEFLRNLDISS